MEEPQDISQTDAAQPVEERTTTGARSRVDGIIVWAIVSIGFLAYLTLGSISTRYWRLDYLQNSYVMDVSSRRILHIWTYELDHLPTVSYQWALKALFGGALAVMVVGVVICVWLMLDEVGTGNASRGDVPPSSDGEPA